MAEPALSKEATAAVGQSSDPPQRPSRLRARKRGGRPLKQLAVRPTRSESGQDHRVGMAKRHLTVFCDGSDRLPASGRPQMGPPHESRPTPSPGSPSPRILSSTAFRPGRMTESTCCFRSTSPQPRMGQGRPTACTSCVRMALINAPLRSPGADHRGDRDNATAAIRRRASAMEGQMFMAARAATEIGIHLKGWTRDEAIGFY